MSAYCDQFLMKWGQKVISSFCRENWFDYVDMMIMAIINVVVGSFIIW